MSVWKDLTVCDFLDIIDLWKLVGLGKMGFKAQTCWTDLLAFWGVWNRSRILNFGPDQLFFRFSRALFTVFAHSIQTPQPLTHFIQIWTSTIYYPMLCLKIAGWVANNVDPDETLQFVASHMGLHCLLRPVWPNTYNKVLYGHSHAQTDS